MEILKQEILHNNYCQQHDHAAVLSLLNHFYFESFSSHIIQVYIFVYIFIKLAIFILFLLSSTVMFFYPMLNICRYEKIFCEIHESTLSWHNPSSDVIFLGVHSESIFLFMEYFFSLENCVTFGLLVSCLWLSQSAQILLINLLWVFSGKLLPLLNNFANLT